MNLLESIILALTVAFPAFVPELADHPNADRVVVIDSADHDWTEAEIEAQADANPRVIVVDVD